MVYSCVILDCMNGEIWSYSTIPYAMWPFQASSWELRMLDSSLLVSKQPYDLNKYGPQSVYFSNHKWYESERMKEWIMKEIKLSDTKEKGGWDMNFGWIKFAVLGEPWKE